MTVGEIVNQIFKDNLHEYEKIFQDMDLYLKLLAETWNEKPRITENDIRDFYMGNELYSYQLIRLLPMDIEVKKLDSTGTTITRQVADMFQHTHSTMLDYGCGVGSDGIMYDHYGYQVTLSDINAPHAKLSSRIAKERGMSFVDLSDISGEFDIVSCIQVLEHVPNPVATLEKLHNICKGLLILDVWFADAGGEVPYHLNTQFGDNNLWQRVVNNIGFEPLILKENGVPIVYRKS